MGKFIAKLRTREKRKLRPGHIGIEMRKIQSDNYEGNINETDSIITNGANNVSAANIVLKKV